MLHLYARRCFDVNGYISAHRMVFCVCMVNNLRQSCLRKTARKKHLIRSAFLPLYPYTDRITRKVVKKPFGFIFLWAVSFNVARFHFCSINILPILYHRFLHLSSVLLKSSSNRLIIIKISTKSEKLYSNY